MVCLLSSLFAIRCVLSLLWCRLSVICRFEMFYGVYYLLFVVPNCSLLCADCCSLFSVRCVLSVVCCLLCVVCPMLSVDCRLRLRSAVCCVLFVCCSLFVFWCLFRVVRCMLFVVCSRWCVA